VICFTQKTVEIIRVRVGLAVGAGSVNAGGLGVINAKFPGT
jgi:hypothetical protein